MRKQTQDYLSSHQSRTPTKWQEEAQWRRENRAWLQYSQHIALVLLKYMRQEGITQEVLAERVGCTQQYISRILKGTENLTLETISKIEKTTGTTILPLHDTAQ